MANAPDPTIPLAEQAAWWWQVFQDGETTVADHRDFAEWTSRSREHVEAYLEIALMHKALKSPSVRWPEISAEQLIREARAAPLEPVHFQQPKASTPRRQEPTWPRSRLRAAIAAAAAAFVALFGVGTWWTSAQPKRYETTIGEQRLVTLGDGSRILMNTASTIEVRLRKTCRNVRLVRGEALFNVAHDANRPFDVNAGNATIRAVGTQFNVDLASGKTTVTIVEGRVAFVSGSVPMLEAGDRLVVSAAGTATISHGVNVDTALAWTRNQLIFDRRPLGEVVDEFNRYNRGRIVIESESLRAEEVTGTFKPDNPAAFVAFLSNIPGVVVRDDGAGGFVISQETS